MKRKKNMQTAGKQKKKRDNSSRIRKTIFAMVNIIKYLPRSVVFSLAIYLKLIKLAMEAINVPSPPIFVPIMSAE